MAGRIFARTFTVLYLLQTLLATLPAHAQVTSAPGAPAGQRPLIDAAANGVPLVLIAPPNASGVSRNQYGQFNVAPQGLILNNATGNAQTRLGGWVKGNLLLGATPARIVLNEVTSNSSSQLRGVIEVAGQRADVVIANPNGKALVKEAKTLMAAGETTKAVEKISEAKAQIHHICTDKNCISSATGGPWTPRFAPMFEKAGMTLQDDLNKVLVAGHQGPHPHAYHELVFERLEAATRGLVGEQYKAALQLELGKMSAELSQPGTALNQLVTRK